MKKILLSILVCFSFFLLIDNVYAEKTIFLDDYTVAISFDDKEDTILVSEKFSINDLSSGIQLRKNMSIYSYEFDSNFLTDPYYISSDNDMREYVFTLYEPGEYYLNYKIKSKKHYEGENYKVEIEPVSSNDDSLVYSNFNLIFKSSEINSYDKKGILSNSALYDFNIEEDGKTITGTYEGLINYTPNVTFYKMSHYNKPLFTHHLFTPLIVASIVMIFISLMKLITRERLFDRLILIFAAILGLSFCVGRIQKIFDSSTDTSIIFPFIFLVIVYGVFFAAFFFTKNIVAGKQTINMEENNEFNMFVIKESILLFPKLFIIFHSYIMLIGFSDMTNFDLFNFSANIDLFILYGTFIISSIAYKIENKEDKKNRFQ